MMNILVLGTTGMLGSMVFHYLSLNKKLNVFGTARDTLKMKNKNIYQFDAKTFTDEHFQDLVIKIKPEYIINCVGAINKYCTADNPLGIQNAILINSLFPQRLVNISKQHPNQVKIILIATDCVFSGSKGCYNEKDIPDPVDIYGKSKSLGEVIDENFLNIRCSIIGPELFNKSSLLEWFLSIKNRETINGFDHHFWNGVTTLQFAQLCEKIILNNDFDKLRKLNHTLHYCVNEIVSKYRLLMIFREVFNREIDIIKMDNGKKLDRTLQSIYLKNENRKMFDSVMELKKFISEKKYYV